MASPNVAGVAAGSYYPKLTASQVKHIDGFRCRNNY
jgi:hypothetical protein